MTVNNDISNSTGDSSQIIGQSHHQKCPHMTDVPSSEVSPTWQMSHHQKCPHMADVPSSEVSSHGRCPIIRSVLTWQMSHHQKCPQHGRSSDDGTSAMWGHFWWWDICHVGDTSDDGTSAMWGHFLWWDICLDIFMIFFVLDIFMIFFNFWAYCSVCYINNICVTFPQYPIKTFNT